LGVLNLPVGREIAEASGDRINMDFMVVTPMNHQAFVIGWKRAISAFTGKENAPGSLHRAAVRRNEAIM
jgi:hypothetical protein